MNNLTNPLTFRRNKDTTSQAHHRHSYFGGKVSKVQDILGISQAELRTASTQSVSSSSTARVQSVSFSEATTVPGSSLCPANTTGSQTVTTKSELDFDAVNTSTDFKPNRFPSLHRMRSYASSSTLQSRYDAKKVPLSVSQQTSDSSSRDFALRKGKPSVLSSVSKEMEHARQLFFVRGSKLGLRLKGDKRSVMQVSSIHDEEGFTPPRRNKQITASIQPETQTSVPSTGSIPSLSHNTNDHGPCAKINIRRPRAGARYWFDGHEGDSSDEEANDEPEFEQAFVNQVHQDYSLRTIDNNVAVSSMLTQTSDHRDRSPRTIKKPGVPYRLTCPPELTTLAVPQTQGKTEIREKRLRTTPSQQSIMTKPGDNLLEKVDLMKHSVLSLSSSDDEDDEFQLHGQAPTTGLLPVIRDSIVTANLEDSEVEIGFAKAVKTKPGEPLFCLTPVRTNTVKPATKATTLSNVTLAASNQIETGFKDVNYNQDVDEQDLIDSFPATPTDATSIRTSTRASTRLSDNVSLTSTRLMKVTKQEEKLLAAMRMKRAAMRKADRDADRLSALQVLESGGRHWSSQPAEDRKQRFNNDQARLDARLSSRYAPSRAYSQRDSFSGDEGNVYPRDSGTTFQTSTGTISVRDSQATARSNFSEELYRPYSICSRPDTNDTMPSGFRSTNAPRSRQPAGRDTFLSMASDTSGHRPDSHIVMLDGLDETLERETIPSQLFMEAPFVGWERVGLMTAY